MKQAEKVYRELLFLALERKQRVSTQKALAEKLQLSLGTVNHSIAPLRRMGAVEVKARSLTIIDPLKLLYHWASVRNVERDIVYRTRVDKPVRSIEADMPPGMVFGMFTAYKLRFRDAPADYSEVYAYGDRKDAEERFPLRRGAPNLFVLAMSGTAAYGATTTIAQTFVDLWNVPEWYAREFLIALEKKIREME